MIWETFARSCWMDFQSYWFISYARLQMDFSMFPRNHFMHSPEIQHVRFLLKVDFHFWVMLIHNKASSQMGLPMNPRNPFPYCVWIWYRDLTKHCFDYQPYLFLIKLSWHKTINGLLHMSPSFLRSWTLFMEFRLWIKKKFWINSLTIISELCCLLVKVMLVVWSG